MLRDMKGPDPDPWADPKSRLFLGFCNPHHRSTRIPELRDLLFGSCRACGDSSAADPGGRGLLPARLQVPASAPGPGRRPLHPSSGLDGARLKEPREGTIGPYC